jgi:predicted AAA+ superfamily ATPase
MQDTKIDLSRLLLYRQLLDDEIIRAVRQLWQKADNKEAGAVDIEVASYYEICSLLLCSSQQENMGGDIWKNHILNLIIGDENIFSQACERNGQNISSSLYNLAKHDLKILKDLYGFDWGKFGRELGIDYPEELFNFTAQSTATTTSYRVYYQDCINDLSVLFAGEAEPVKLLDKLIDFYYRVGIGKLGKYVAFKWDNNSLVPIREHDPIVMQDLVGYDYQKEVLTKNTAAFLQGKKANNVLLYGKKGTGKSSMVKALLNQYAGAGLRMLELSKEQLSDFGHILRVLRERALKFIIYIDDLSFEDFEVGYKHIKSNIEGSLEVTSDNVLIYVTSNRRHLIKENWVDRENVDAEVHAADTEQEKLSLADRFGITLSFQSPEQEEYLQIVTELAIRNGIKMDPEELRQGALRWERRNNGRSGRTAQQYINHLL